jgi:hypothetical protein
MPFDGAPSHVLPFPAGSGQVLHAAGEFPPLRRSGGYLRPVGAGVRLSGSVWACQAVSYSSGLR